MSLKRKIRAQLHKALARPKLWQLAATSPRWLRYHIIPAVYWIPDELLENIFDFLDQPDIVRARQVCKSWRRVAETHPGIARTVRIDSVELGALDWAKKQLSAVRSSAFDLSVDICEEHPRIESAVLDMMVSRLGKIRTLYVRLNSIYIVGLWRVIEWAAPLLESVDIELYLAPGSGHPDILGFPISPSVFGGSAITALRRVALGNIILPYPGPITAFAHIEDLGLCFPMDTTVFFPVCIFDFFPKLRRLGLGGNALAFTDSPLPPSVIKGVASLTYLELHFNGDGNIPFFDNIPTDSIPTLLVGCPGRDTIYEALACLRGPFQMMVTNAFPRVVVTVRSLWNGYLRNFVEYHSHYTSSEPEPNMLLENQEFADQLYALVLATSVWQLVRPFLPNYRILPILVVLIDDASGGTTVQLPSQPIPGPCLGLRKLVLKATSPVFAEAPDVVQFLERITSHGDAVELELFHVEIQGPRQIFDGRFTSVRRLRADETD